jgi:hypothetical protein
MSAAIRFGIGEQPDRRVLAVLAGLLLELGHPVEPADAGDAVEDPGELGVRRTWLWLKRIERLGIDAGGEHRGRHLARVGASLGILPDGDGVQVDDAVDALELVLQAHPVADGPR